MKKNVCPFCKAELEKTPKSRKIGFPLVMCPKCKKWAPATKVVEFGALTKSKQTSYFCNSAIILIGILLPLALCVGMFFVDKLFSFIPLVLIPIIIGFSIAARRSRVSDDVELSIKRCSYGEYLCFLKENGIYIAPKVFKKKSKSELDLQTIKEIFSFIADDAIFQSYLPATLRVKYNNNTLDDLVRGLNADSALSRNIKNPDDLSIDDLLSDFDGSTVTVSNIAAIEKFIYSVIVKYKFKCNNAKFQNIKIDIISYLEDSSSPDIETMKRLVFDGLKE